MPGEKRVRRRPAEGVFGRGLSQEIMEVGEDLVEGEKTNSKRFGPGIPSQFQKHKGTF